MCQERELDHNDIFYLNISFATPDMPSISMDNYTIPSVDNFMIITVDDYTIPSVDNFEIPSMDNSTIPSGGNSKIPLGDNSNITSLDQGSSSASKRSAPSMITLVVPMSSPKLSYRKIRL